MALCQRWCFLFATTHSEIDSYCLGAHCNAISVVCLVTSFCGSAQGHPYRNICDLRHGASTSLIELEFASHTGADADPSPRVPSGLPFYTLTAQLRELELVFLNRFLQVGLLAMLISLSL